MRVGNARFTWTASASTDVDHYMLYEGTATGVYSTSPTNVGNVTSYVHNISVTGERYFAMTAVDASDNESEFSNEVHEDFWAPFAWIRTNLG